MAEYNIGDIFEKPCPPDVADWCLANNAYIDDYEGGKLVIKAVPDETPAERKEIFLKKFFKVNLGDEIGDAYYRKQPKGYQSAIESINTAYNISKENGGLPANVLIFYPQPDFEVAEQCTEQWLVANQIKLPAMAHAQFVELFNLFVTTWNSQEH